MRHAQLRAFHHVAEEGGFSRAAEAMGLTQPAVSDQVKQLETAYDVRLFDRSHRRVRLTEAGRALHAITRRLFEAEREAAEFLSEAQALRAGHLRVVADSAHHLLAGLAAFRARHPGVQVTVRTGNSETVLAALRAWEAEIGVMGEPPEGPEFITRILNETPIVAFVARDHPLAGEGALPLARLPELPLVMREAGSRTRAKVEAAAARAGLRLTPAIEAEGREAVREIVAAGGGVGFTSMAEFGADARLVALPLSPDEGLMMREALVALRERRHARLVAAFLNLL
jgi:aminoethylphosphonate catabolism LysR family transcriptional regulator